MTKVVLLDTSRSMALPVTGEKRRIDVLTTVLGNVMASAPAAKLVTFSDEVHVLERATDIPEPDGGTDLHVALAHIAPWSPRTVVVISDGEPSDRLAALRAARSLGSLIHAHHVGDEGDRAAVTFMRNLGLCSHGGIGRAAIGDLRNPRKLASDLSLLLTGPGR